MENNFRTGLLSLLLALILGVAAVPAQGAIEASCILNRPCSVRPLNGGLFLLVNQGMHTEVWVSDGTSAGTVLVKALPEMTGERKWPEIGNVISAGDGMIFDYYEMYSDDLEPGLCPYSVASSIWVSDGTTDGTVMLAEGEYTCVENVGTLGNAAFFSMYDDGAFSFWRSDGTAAGTSVLKSDFAAHKDGFELNNVLYFRGRSSADPRFNLWRTDGTAEGTYTLLPAGSGCSEEFVEMGGVLYFSGFYGTGPYRLSRSDGTVEGTYPLQPEGRYCQRLSAANNLLYFEDMAPAGAQGVYRSDGTPEGTYRILDLPSSEYYGAGMAVAAGDRAVFNVYACTGYYSLWGTDGSPEGTSKLLDAAAPWRWPSYITPFGDAAYFLLEDATGGSGFWETDGTIAGTELVVNFEDGLADLLTDIDGRLYFCCEVGGDCCGIVVYASDGTAAGTVPLSEPLPTMSMADAPENAAPKCSPPDPVRQLWSEYGLIYLIWDDTLFGLYETQFQQIILHDSALGAQGYPGSYPVMLGDALYFGGWNGLWVLSLNFRFTRTPHAPWREAGDRLVLNVECEGYIGSISYQWYKDGAIIDGATSAEFCIDSLTEEDEGWYSCRVTDTAKAVHETQPVFVEVLEPGSLPASGLPGLLALSAALVMGAARAMRRKH